MRPRAVVAGAGARPWRCRKSRWYRWRSLRHRCECRPQGEASSSTCPAGRPSATSRSMPATGWPVRSHGRQPGLEQLQPPAAGVAWMAGGAGARARRARCGSAHGQPARRGWRALDVWIGAAGRACSWRCRVRTFAADRADQPFEPCLRRDRPVLARGVVRAAARADVRAVLRRRRCPLAAQRCTT